MKVVSAKLRTVLAVAAMLLLMAGFFFGAGWVRNTASVLSGRVTARRPVVILDAGHGGEDGGAIGQNGVIEKDINLAIALQLRDLLTVSGFQVVMVREDDRLICEEDLTGVRNRKRSDLENRLEIFSEYPDGVVLSIHQNRFEVSRYAGAQMFYGKNHPQSQQLARSMQQQFQQLLQPDNQREIKQSGREIWLLWEAENPIVMAECGFLSNPEECEKLTGADYQRQVAFTLLAGLWQGMAEAGML